VDTVGAAGWLGVRLDRDPDGDELVSIVDEAYRLVAPKYLVARLDDTNAETAVDADEP
jgi:hypothetical protein